MADVLDHPLSDQEVGQFGQAPGRKRQVNSSRCPSSSPSSRTWTQKMGPGFRQFAEYQPFTPIIETLRGFLNGAPATSDVIAALAWCVGIALVGYLWASSTFKKRA